MSPGSPLNEIEEPFDMFIEKPNEPLQHNRVLVSDEQLEVFGR
jgi:hypothetical protein